MSKNFGGSRRFKRGGICKGEISIGISTDGYVFHIELCLSKSFQKHVFWFKINHEFGHFRKVELNPEKMNILAFFWDKNWIFLKLMKIELV